MNVEQAKQILKEAGYVMHFWNKEDIKAQAEEENITLTDEQLIEVSEHLADTCCDEGINWMTISGWINYVVDRDK